MKVLLTGASGFVGSHVLDRLKALSIPTRLLLRTSSSVQFFKEHLAWADTCPGSLQEPESLSRAVNGVTHVIHCAGATKALSREQFFEINQVGTRNLVSAMKGSSVQRMLHVSSLAASGPATAEKPALEGDVPKPISVYGQSKLAGELEVREGGNTDYTIVRPPAVYGPRDLEFLRLFKAVLNHIEPQPTRQPLSLVYVCDLAAAIVACLNHPQARNKVFYAAAPEIVTAAKMARAIASLAGVWTIPLPLPTQLLWPVCLAHQARSWVTGVPGVLSLQKYPELRAKGWVCDTCADAEGNGS